MPCTTLSIESRCGSAPLDVRVSESSYRASDDDDENRKLVVMHKSVPRGGQGNMDPRRHEGAQRML
jgi:hypothetical protein